MIKRVLLSFYEIEEVDSICIFIKEVAKKFKIDICGIYVKDIRKYEISTPSVEGIVIEERNEYALKEWEEQENKKATEIAKKFKEYFPDEVFLIEEGIPADTLSYRMRGYDFLVAFKGEKVRNDIRNIIKSRYKPVILVPKLENYKLENVMFADDDGDNANRSFFLFMTLFEKSVHYNVVSVNIDMKERGLEDYMEFMGASNRFYELSGEEFEELKKELLKNDLLVMGNLRYFYMIEKIIGKTGVKLLEQSNKPVFIA